MNKAGIALGGTVLIIAIAAAAYTLSHNYHSAPTAPEQLSGKGNSSVGANGASSIITYTDAGFTPAQLSVVLGTTVTWSNQSSHPLWVEAKGSGGDCKIQVTSNLNECTSISSGGTYSYTFTKLGTVSYVNHQRTADTGIVKVTEATSAGPINPSAIPE